MTSIWDVLEIEATSEEKIIKRAYSKKLKALDTDIHHKEFIELREAYTAALNHIDLDTYEYEEEIIKTEGLENEYIQNENDDIKHNDDVNHDFTYESIIEDTDLEIDYEDYNNYLYEKCLEDKLENFEFRMSVDFWIEYFSNRNISASLDYQDFISLLSFVEEMPVLPCEVWNFIKEYVVSHNTYSSLQYEDEYKRITNCIMIIDRFLSFSFTEKFDKNFSSNQDVEGLYEQISELHLSINNCDFEKAKSIYFEIKDNKYLGYWSEKILKAEVNVNLVSRFKFKLLISKLLKDKSIDKYILLYLFDLCIEKEFFCICKKIIKKMKKNKESNLYIILSMKLGCKRNKKRATRRLYKKYMNLTGLDYIEKNQVEFLKKFDLLSKPKWRGFSYLFNRILRWGIIIIYSMVVISVLISNPFIIIIAIIYYLYKYIKKEFFVHANNRD